jgi:hypothetical protein
VTAKSRAQLRAEVLQAKVKAGGLGSLWVQLSEAGSQEPISGADLAYEVFDPAGVAVVRGSLETGPVGDALVTIPIDLWARAGLWSFQVSGAGQVLRGAFEVVSPVEGGLRVAWRALREGREIVVSVLARDASGLPLESGEAALRLNDAEEKAAIVRGGAQLRLSAPSGALVGLSVGDGARFASLPVGVPDELLSLRFVPERGALHEKFPVRGVIVVQDDQGRPLAREVSVSASGREVAKVSTNESGFARVELPGSVRGAALVLSSGGSVREVEAPLVLSGPAVRCEKALAVVGESLSCEAYLPGGEARPLLVSTDGQLVGVVWVSAGEGPRPVEVKLPARGLAVLSFGLPRESAWFVSVGDARALSLSLEKKDDGDWSVQANTPDAASQPVSLLVGRRAAEDGPRLSPRDEAEARYLFASFQAETPHARASSTLAEDQGQLNEFRRRIGTVLRWILILLGALFVLPALGFALVKTRLFRVVVPTLGLALGLLRLVPGFGWEGAALVLLAGLVVGALWLRGEKAEPFPLWAGALGLLGAAGLLWSWGGVHFPPLQGSAPLRLAESAGGQSPRPVGLWENAEAVSFESGAVQSVKVSEVSESGYLPSVEAFSANALAGYTAGEREPAAPLFLSLSLPARMAPGDKVSVPFALENRGDAALSVAVEALSLDPSVEARLGRQVYTVAPFETVRGEVALTARDPGSAWVALAADVPGGQRISLTEQVMVVSARAEQREELFGSTQAAVTLAESRSIKEPRAAQVEIFASPAAALYAEEQGLPLGCGVDAAARLSSAALSLGKLPGRRPELLARSQRALQALAAQEVTSGGFSACGGPFDPAATAAALVALYDARELSGDASWRSRARRSLAEWLAAAPLSEDSALAAWALSLEATAEPESHRILARFLDAQKQEELPEVSALARAALAAAYKAANRSARAKEVVSIPTSDDDMMGPAALALRLFAQDKDDSTATRLDELFAMNPPGALDRLLRARALLFFGAASSAPEVTVSAGNASLASASLADEPSLTVALSPAEAKRSLNVTTSGPVWYRVLRTGLEKETKEKARGLGLAWPKESAQGSRVAVPLSLEGLGQGPVVVSVPLPSLYAVDPADLADLIAAGKLLRFALRAGMLWLVLPSADEAPALPLVAQRAGKAQAPAARAFSLHDWNLSLSSQTAELAVKP